MTYQKVNIHSEDDIYYALSCVRYLMRRLPFTDLERASVCVCVLELTRNVLDHANANGTFHCDVLDNGLRIIVSDNGLGIPYVEDVINGKAHSSSKGLGLGLTGVKRLMDNLEIETSHAGTKVTATKRCEHKQGERFNGSR